MYSDVICQYVHVFRPRKLLPSPSRIRSSMFFFGKKTSHSLEEVLTEQSEICSKCLKDTRFGGLADVFCVETFTGLVVSNMFDFHPDPRGKRSNLTNICQMG